MCDAEKIRIHSSLIGLKTRLDADATELYDRYWCFLWTLKRLPRKSMADGMARPRVIMDELLHCGQTYSEPTMGISRS